jgi:uncharacterized protein YndB with AHSA1/START domain
VADILHDFSVKAPCGQVFRAIATPKGLDSWWTKRSSGEPVLGAEYSLWFGPEYDWRAIVSRVVPDVEFELAMTRADADWKGTRVGFLLEETGGVTRVRFQHTGWPEANEHYRGSCYCWAMYLRLLTRFVETREVVAYEDRDSA